MEEMTYRASILDFDCYVARATLEMNNNLVTRNQFQGPGSTLIYINGGIALVADNEFSYNGLLSHEEFISEDQTLNRQYTRSNFPWDDITFGVNQENGIFYFQFDDRDMPSGTAHIFERNRFEHIYCQLGCAYYVTGTQIQ